MKAHYISFCLVADQFSIFTRNRREMNLIFKSEFKYLSLLKNEYHK